MRINHVLVLTTDMEAMTSFLTNSIGLSLGERPPFPFPGAWFYSEGQPLVHVALTEKETRSPSVINHLALEGANYEDLMLRLKAQHQDFDEKRVPVSDELQIFVKGPDGLRVEMLFASEKDFEGASD